MTLPPAPKMPKLPEWMSYCPERDRKNPYKIQSALNHAKLSLHQWCLPDKYGYENYGRRASHGIIFKLVDGEWVKYLEVTPETELSWTGYKFNWPDPLI